ncbi:unnamed protein product, partial [Brenthis ino]
MNNDSEFSNPNNLPVEIVTVSVKNSGVIQQIKALDPYWVEKKDFIQYERPPSGPDLLLGAVDAWKTKMEIYLGNLKWLLELEHHRFWSTILHHPQCMDAIISFIQDANPPYLELHDSKDVQKLYEEIRRLILVVFSRLVTNKESKSQWMTKEFMADLIYNNFIFTIPVLWDLCLTYGADNTRHMSKLMETVFTIQPKYQNDAIQALVFVQEAFKFIILQVNKDYESEEPPNLPETFKGFSEIKRPSGSKNPDKITFSILKDLVIHMLDMAMTLRIFVEVYPKSAELMKKINFLISIVQLYEYGIPHLYEKLQEVGDETSITFTEVEGYIDLARAELIDMLKEILAVYKNAILDGEGSIVANVEAYLSLMMDLLSERLLIKDYHACYPVHEDLEMLKQAYPDIDTVKTDFILQAIYSNIDEPIPEELINSHTIDNLTNGHIESIDNAPGPSKDNEIPDSIREQSLISEVKDILPHLGDGYVLKCLQHYSFSAERVINAILEDTLADSLRGLDTSLPIIPEDIVDKKYLETGIERLNVFDGDQFDIMTRDDVDLSKIHVGKKKEKYRNMKDMLDDKTEVKKRVDIYSKYNLVCDEVSMYSDEYDDTYDSDGIAPTDATDERRPFVTPRALQKREVQEESDESEEVEEEKPNNNRNRIDFCVNPEEMRARREANIQVRRGKGHRPPPPRNTDVVGKPKGQGQEKEVLVSRDKKEKHKSARANHNRRQGAQWKRSQGMMPS